jgi:hypothetical protein
MLHIFVNEKKKGCLGYDVASMILGSQNFEDSGGDQALKRLYTLEGKSLNNTVVKTIILT